MSIKTALSSSSSIDGCWEVDIIYDEKDCRERGFWIKLGISSFAPTDSFDRVPLALAGLASFSAHGLYPGVISTELAMQTCQICMLQRHFRLEGAVKTCSILTH